MPDPDAPYAYRLGDTLYWQARCARCGWTCAYTPMEDATAAALDHLRRWHPQPLQDLEEDRGNRLD